MTNKREKDHGAYILKERQTMSNTHNKYNIYMLHCKVRNAMENRKSKGRGAGSGGGRAVCGI